MYKELFDKLLNIFWGDNLFVDLLLSTCYNISKKKFYLRTDLSHSKPGSYYFSIMRFFSSNWDSLGIFSAIISWKIFSSQQLKFFKRIKWCRKNHYWRFSKNQISRFQSYFFCLVILNKSSFFVLSLITIVIR